MKKFTEYKCDTCKRTTVIQNDTKRVFVPKCNITFKCEGRLYSIGEKNTKEITATKPAAGLEDWRQRGSTTSFDPEIQDEIFLSLASGTNNQITLAVKNIPDPGPTVIATFNVVKDVATSFKEFTYDRLSPISQVNGVDDSLDKKILRFESGDVIRVFINGVESPEGGLPGWTRDVLSNTINFNPTLIDDSVIVVIISAAQIPTVKTLTFDRNVSGGNPTSVWGNVNTISYKNDEYNLYTCTSTDLDIDVNTSLSLVGLNGIANIPLIDSMFLLSYEPWSPIDRIVSYYGNCLLLSNSIANIRMTKVDNNLQIQISDFGISDAFPLLKINSLFDITETYSDDQIAGVDFLTAHNNKYILGPV